jgi:dihydrodipicolinate synthase/N-acetylneuraminate lyase
MKLKGRIVPIATPLDKEERVNESQLRYLVDYLIDKGVHGFWANGGFGGQSYLRDSEQFRAMRVVIDQVKKRVPVLVGISDTSVTRVLDKAALMTEYGPDGLFLLPTPYDTLSSSQIIDFYKDVASHVSPPLYIYHNPWSTHVTLDADTIIALGRHPNIKGIKDSSENPYLFVALAQHFKDTDFTLLAGTMPLAYYAMTLGFDGVVDPTDQVYTDLAVAQFNATQSGDWDQALKIQYKLDKLGLLTMSLGDYRAAVEACMNMLGLCDRIHPRPYAAIEDEGILKRLRAALSEADIKPARS